MLKSINVSEEKIIYLFKILSDNECFFYGVYFPRPMPYTEYNLHVICHQCP